MVVALRVVVVMAGTKAAVEVCVDMGEGLGLSIAVGAVGRATVGVEEAAVLEASMEATRWEVRQLVVVEM